MPNNLPSRFRDNTSAGWSRVKHERALARVHDTTAVEIEQIRGEVVKSAAVIRGAEYLGHEVMAGLNSLRRHEARAAADDPIVADEYAAVRRVVLGAALDELEDFGRRTR